MDQPPRTIKKNAKLATSRSKSTVDRNPDVEESPNIAIVDTSGGQQTWKPTKRQDKEVAPNKQHRNPRRAVSGLPSAQKISVEIQQLVIQFNEILKVDRNDPSMRVNEPPYIQYFHRAVEKVTSSLKRLLEQKTIQASVFSWIDSNVDLISQNKKGPQMKEKSGDEVMREINRDLNYFNRVHVEAEHDLKSGRSLFERRHDDGNRERRWTTTRRLNTIWTSKGATKNSLSASLYSRICTLKSDVLRDDLLPLVGAEFDSGTRSERMKLEQMAAKSESESISKDKLSKKKTTAPKTKKSLAATLRDCFKRTYPQPQVSFMTSMDSDFDSVGESQSFSQFNSIAESAPFSQFNSTYSQQTSSPRLSQQILQAVALNRHSIASNQYSIDDTLPSFVEEEISSPSQVLTRHDEPCGKPKFCMPRNLGTPPVRNCILMHSTSRDAETRYLQKCNDHGVLPGRNGFHCAIAKDVNLAGHNLDDKTIKAVAGAISMRVQDIETVNLSANRGSDDSMVVLLQALESPIPRMLDLLNISQNRLGAATFDLLSSMLRGRQLDVRCLRIGGMAIPVASWKTLCGAILVNGHIREIDLSDTQCGRHCQDPCVQVASLCFAIETLDISQNFFREEGLREISEALHSRTHVKTLRLTDNTWLLQSNVASGQWRQPKAEKKTLPRQALASEGKTQDPMLSFCEALGYNHTLTSLDLSGCQIAEEASICLEDALMDHATLKQINLSRNPLGESGMRAILRLVMRTGNLQLVNLCEFRENTSKPSITFNYTDLTEEFSGHDALDLSNPYHRAILRLIIRRVQETGVSLSDGVVNFKVNGASQQPSFEMRNGRAEVPKSGIVEFLYCLDPVSDAISCPADAVKAWQGCRRMRVRFSRFVILMHIYRQLRLHSERQIFLAAAAKDLLFKLGQVTFLAQAVAKTSSELVTDMLCGFTTTFENADRATINVALRCVRGKMPMKHIFQDYMSKNGAVLKFNPDNATGRYRLFLENPGDYSVAEQLIVVSQWEGQLALKQELMDLGEAGGYCGFRNFNHDGIDFIYKTSWLLPGDGFVGRGTLKCDYVTPFARPKRSSTAKKLPEAQFSKFLTLIQGEGTDASEKSRLETLRAVSHRVYLSAKQVHSILISLSSEYVTRIYVCLFPRCLQFGPPMVDRFSGILGDRSLFDSGSIKELEERLGLPNVMDVLNIHVHPWNHFCWDLSKRDQHMCAYLAIVLASIEPGENIKKPNWNKAQSLGTSGTWCVPSSWSDGMPNKGTFSMTYTCELESAEYVMVDKRKELGRKTFGWVSLGLAEGEKIVDGGG